MKKCSRCRRVLDEACFGRKCDTFDGLNSQCNDCIREAHRAYAKTEAGKATQRKADAQPERKRKRYMREHPSAGQCAKNEVATDSQPSLMDPEVVKKRRRIIKHYRLTQNFGMTIDEHEAMLLAQDYKCAICGGEETAVQRGIVQDLGVDHDHKTNIVRGLLCHNCNSMLGDAKDRIEILFTAMCYLRDHKLKQESMTSPIHKPCVTEQTPTIVQNAM